TDPRPYWRKLDVPALVLIGERDVQVPAGPNLAELRAALAEGGNADVDLRALAGLNHLFQHARTGLVDEYARSEETFDPATLTVISDWIRAHTGLVEQPDAGE